MAPEGLTWYNNTMKISQHPLYQTWNGMVRRCRDTKNINYPHYGAKGIDVYEEWSIRGEWGTTEVPPGFLCFLSYIEEHLGDKPDGYTLDRIDNSGDYEPGNIRWADMHTQNYNRSSKLGALRNIRRVPSGRFQVNVCVNRTKQYLGTYDTIEEATMVRDKWYSTRGID